MGFENNLNFFQDKVCFLNISVVNFAFTKTGKMYQNICNMCMMMWATPAACTIA